MNTRKRNRKPSEERCQITPYSASKISKIDKVTNTDASVAEQPQEDTKMEEHTSETSPSNLELNDTADFQHNSHADEFSSQSISSTTEDILREADVLIAEVTEYRRELNETQNDSAEIDTEATILVNGNDAAHPSSHNNDSTVVIGVTEPGASAQSTNSASNSNTNKNDDSVVVIDDSMTSSTQPAARCDDDVIFVTETRGPQRHRTVAMIDLCDSPDTDNKPSTAKPAQPGMTKCPICLDMYGFNEILSTMCGHLFCEPCIKSVIKSRKKCPMCNRGLKPNQVHRIFLDS